MARPKGSKKNGWKYLDESKLSRFFAAVNRAKNLKHELWFDLCLWFGLRVTELTHLRSENIKSNVYGIEIQASPFP